MPSKGMLVIRTDTCIGKTVVTAGLVYLLRLNGYDACYFKPILSGAAFEEGCFIPGDSRFVKMVSGIDEEYEDITVYSFKTPVFPHLASRIENVCIEIDVIKNRLEYLKSKYWYIIAEGCGGLAVPLDYNGLMLHHLVLELGFSLVIVAKAGLGTTNHTILTVEFAVSKGIKVKGIIINGYSRVPYEDDNIEIIQNITGIPVLGVIPRLEGLNTDSMLSGNLREILRERVDVQKIINVMDEI